MVAKLTVGDSLLVLVNVLSSTAFCANVSLTRDRNMGFVVRSRGVFDVIWISINQIEMCLYFLLFITPWNNILRDFPSFY